MKISLSLLILRTISCIYAASIEKNGLAEELAQNGGIVTILNGGRIVGGSPTTIEQFPWTVSMQRFGGHRCGSSTISPTRFLTAAHCTVGLPASGLQLRAGSTMSESGGQVVQLTNIINHPQYNPNTLNNDITIMWIGTPLNMAPAGVAAIALPAQGAGVATGALATVTGWGHTTEGGSNSPNLRFVAVPIVSNAQCNANYGGGITDGMLCAGFPEGGRDACQNDSGGPLTLGGQQVGVVSWGEGCARPNRPGVYVRVAFYRNWINANI